MKPFVYSGGLDIHIPDRAVRATILMRHSDSVQEGENAERTLNLPRGVDICRAVEPELTAFTSHLAREFGAPRFVHSGWPRSYLTLFLVTGADRIEEDMELRSKLSAKTLPALSGNGQSFADSAKAKGWTRQQMLGEMVRNISGIIDQGTHLHPNLPWRDAAETVIRTKNCITDGNFGNMVVAVGHENVLSLVAGVCRLPAHMLGLKWCQAFVFFMDDKGKVISVQKFTPTATLKLPED